MAAKRRLRAPGAALVAAAGACVALLSPSAVAAADPIVEPSAPVVVAFATTDDDGGPRVASAVADSSAAAQRLVEALRDTPGVEAANVSVPMRRMGAVDPRLSAQWGLAALSFGGTRAWSTGSGVVVAVVDDGVDRSHPDLAGALLPGRNIARPGQPVDAGSHGTHVSGIVAARYANGVGGSGLAPRARILPVDVFGDGEYTTDVSVAQGVVWAARQPGVRVINMSLGGAPPSDVLHRAIDFARSRNIVVVAAAGNDGQRQINYPAGFTGVLGVGAVDSSLRLAPFSSTGSHVDLVAPGASILSTSCRLDYATLAADVCPNSTVGGQVAHTYEHMDGTSMATPFVSASAALLAARFPTWTSQRIIAELLDTARDLGARGRDDAYGHGLVQPLAVLRGAPGSPAGSRIASGPSAITVHWNPSNRSGSYGIASWRVQYRLDSGAWQPAVTVPYAGHTCDPTPCSLRIAAVPVGHLVQSRVTAVAKVTGAASAASVARAWHGPDAGQTVAGATTLSPGTSTRGVIATASDADWFRVTPSGATLQVVLSGRSGVVATIYDASDTSTPLASGPAGSPAGLSASGLTPGAPYIVAITGSAAPLTPYLLTVS